MANKTLYVEDWCKTVVIPKGKHYNSYEEGYPDYVKYCNKNNYTAKILEEYVKEINESL